MEIIIRIRKNTYKFTVSLGYDADGKQIRKYKTYVAETGDNSPVKLDKEVKTRCC